jgi:hypothetical protein
MRVALKMAFVVAALCSLVCGQTDCKPKITELDGSVTQYDLSALCHKDGAPDVYTLDVGNHRYYINLCGTVTADCPSGSTVCEREDDTIYHSCGMLSTQSWYPTFDVEPGQGLTAVYSDGDACDSGLQRESTVNLVCDTTTEGILENVLEGDCSYIFSFRSKYACGVSEGSDESKSKSGSDVVGLVVLIILICATVVYFVGGAVYQKKVKNAQGLRELTIHNEFWCALPGLVADGCNFILHGCKKGDYLKV